MEDRETAAVPTKLASNQTRGPIEAELQELNKGLGALAEQISVLENRVSAVLTPAPVPELFDREMAGSSEVMGTLNDFNRHVAIMSQYVRHITERVEL